jgi:putative effector of murein hydrolase LrgA (UPF0299 family)
LRYLPLILIPPSVGIMDHWPALKQDGGAVALTIVLTTTLSLVLAAGVLHGLNAWFTRKSV